MRSFEVKNENEVLINIPSGKSYLGDHGIFKRQAGQKGKTCRYYALNYLRTRYGKNFIPQEHPGRRIEVILSAYRKRATGIEQGFNMGGRAGGLIVDNCVITLNKFGVDPGKALREFLEMVNVPADGLSIYELCAAYETIVFLEAIKRYELKLSFWHPGPRVDSLMTELRENGPLVISIISRRSAEPHFITPDIQTRRAMMTWYPEEYLGNKNKDAHHVVLVGAKKTGDDEYVYYLDPEEASDNSSLYRIPYAILRSEIMNIYDVTENGVNADKDLPVAIYSDHVHDSQSTQSLR